MKVENRSGYSLKFLQPLIDRAVKATGGKKLFMNVQLRITEHGSHGEYSGGNAEVETGPIARMSRLQDENRSGYSLKSIPNTSNEAVVDLELSRGLSYPLVMPAHMVSIGDVAVHSFEEEVLLVLAHELRHVLQLRDGFPRWFLKGEEYFMEEDAERHAVGVVEGWRRRKGQTTVTFSYKGSFG